MSEASERHMDRGLELYEAGKLVEAISEWREASRLDSEDACLYNNIGIALSELGQQDAALAEWQEAVRLRPNFRSPHISLAHALSASGYSPDALAAVRVALHLCSDDAGLYVWLGYHLMVEAGESDDRTKAQAAEAAFQRAIDLAQADFHAFLHLGKLQWWLGKKQEAIKTLKDAIAVDPNDAELHIALWEYQGRTRHFRDMVRTVMAINNLPESEVLNQHFERLNHSWLRLQNGLLIAAGTSAFLVWIWIRWQKRR